MYCIDSTRHNITLSRELLLEALAYIKKYRNDIRQDTGICGAVKDYIYSKGYVLFARDLDGLQNLFPSWKHFSGDTQFPIPNVKFDSPMHEFSRTFNKWDKHTEYGSMRIALLEHCIKTLKKQIKDKQATYK